MSVRGLTEDHLEVGMEVLVWDYYWTQRNPSHPPRRATITKIGRTLVTLRASDAHSIETQYRIDGQGENTDRGSGGRFRTMAQAAEEQHRREALARLKAGGLVPAQFGCDKIPTATLGSLAAILEGALASGEISG